MMPQPDPVVSCEALFNNGEGADRPTGHPNCFRNLAAGLPGQCSPALGVA